MRWLIFFHVCVLVFSQPALLSSVCVAISMWRRLPTRRGVRGGGQDRTGQEVVGAPGWLSLTSGSPAARPPSPIYAAASFWSWGRIIFRPWRCIWLVRSDFMSWLPFPALRFLPLGLHVRYREPHQSVQHQRNTSATCCTHLHPPERAPVCGGWDQHQRSKYKYYPHRHHSPTHPWGPLRWPTGTLELTQQCPLTARCTSHPSSVSVHLVTFCTSTLFCPTTCRLWDTLHSFPLWHWGPRCVA